MIPHGPTCGKIEISNTNAIIHVTILDECKVLPGSKVPYRSLGSVEKLHFELVSVTG